jgi:hypothetical protein
MKTTSIDVMVVGALAIMCLLLIVRAGNVPVVAAEAEPGTKERGLLESKDEMIAAYKSSVARVVSTLADKKIRESDRPTTVAAIELAGELRAKEAVLHLADLMLYGKTGPIEDPVEIGRVPARPDSAAPAVRALIDIGMPSLEAVSQKLLSTSKSTLMNKNTLRLHCLWVIWKVLGTDLGKAYLVLCQERHPEPKAWFDDAMNFFKVREDMEKAAAVKREAATQK